MEKANQRPESDRKNSVMWIVQLALRRPYTFIVAALLLLIVSPLVILRTPTDIFPNINIPVVSIVWQYTGMPPTEFAGRITSVYERALTTTVNDIEGRNLGAGCGRPVEPGHSESRASPSQSDDRSTQF